MRDFLSSTAYAAFIVAITTAIVGILLYCVMSFASMSFALSSQQWFAWRCAVGAAAALTILVLLMER